MKKLCYILLFFGLVLSLIGLYQKGLSVNASQSLLDRTTNEYTIQAENVINMFQAPNDITLIENDGHNYSIVSVLASDGVNYNDYLLLRRNGVSSFHAYGPYGNDLGYDVMASDFILVYISLLNNVYHISIVTLEINTSTQALELKNILINNVEIGSTAPHIKIRGITYGHYYYGGATGTNALQYAIQRANSILAPNLSDIYDDIGAQAYNRGYANGYDNGYSDGQQGESAATSVWTLISGIFTSLGAIFAIELFPHIPLGIFFLVPLFFAVVGLILWIWRRN